MEGTETKTKGALACNDIQHKDLALITSTLSVSASDNTRLLDLNALRLHPIEGSAVPTSPRPGVCVHVCTAVSVRTNWQKES